MRMRYLGLALAALLLMLAAVSACSSTTTSAGPVFSGPKSFTADLTSGKVASVAATTADQILSVTLTDGSTYSVPYLDLKTVDRMLAEHPGVSYSVDGKVKQ
jgi:hypothetical protein